MNHHNFMDWQERRNKAYKMAQWSPEEKTKGYSIDVTPLDGKKHSLITGEHASSPDNASIELNPQSQSLEEKDSRVTNNPTIGLTIPDKQIPLAHQILAELHSIHNGILADNSDTASVIRHTDPRLNYGSSWKPHTLEVSEPHAAVVSFAKSFGQSDDPDKPKDLTGGLVRGLSRSFGAFLLHHLIQNNPLASHGISDHMEETNSPSGPTVQVHKSIAKNIAPELLKKYQNVVGKHISILEDYLHKKIASKKPYTFGDHLKATTHPDLRNMLIDLLKGKQDGQTGK